MERLFIFAFATVAFAIAQDWTKLNCPAPRSPTNGINIIFDDGKRVEYRCHPGFVIQGRHISYCVNNRWTSPPPLCVRPNSVLKREEIDVRKDSASFPSSRVIFNWNSEDMTKDPDEMSVVYGTGSNRLPLINGFWKYQNYGDSSVLSIVPGSPYTRNSVPPEDLIGRELDIALLRHKVEEEIKKSRGINKENSKEIFMQSPHFYPPVYSNGDGYVVGVRHENSRPVYHFGELAEAREKDNHKPSFYEPEVAELRRKQIEEARNIQMNAANKRHRDQFKNTLTYSSRDIPIWHGRMTSSNKHRNEETMYKPARVETNRYSNNRFNTDWSTSTTKPPYRKSNDVNTIRNFVQTTKPTVAHRNWETGTTKVLKENNTLHVFVATVPIPTPIVEMVNPFTQIKERNETTLPTRNIQMLTTKRPKKEQNVNTLDWPLEALWFKQSTTTTATTTTTKPYFTEKISRTKTSLVTRKSKRRGSKARRPNKQTEKKPQVTHYSHGRVKSTNPVEKQKKVFN